MMGKYILFLISWTLKLDAASLSNDTSYINIAGYPKAPNCQYDSCHNQCGAAPVRMNPNRIYPISPCYCDSVCILYGDCCFDYFENCLGSNISDISQSDKYKSIENTLLKEQKALEYQTCSGSAGENLFWTIRSCSRDAVTDDSILDCEVEGRNAIGGVPVTLIENPTITFANYYCAKCHGFERNMVRFWHSYVMCNNGTDLTGMSFTQVEKLILLGTCRVHSQPNRNDKPRLCYKDFTKVEPKTTVTHVYGETSTHSSDTNTLSPDIARWMTPTFVTPHTVSTTAPEIYLEDADRLCSLYIYPVIDENSTIYQNAHCALSVLGKGTLDTPIRCASQKIPPVSFQLGTPWWTNLLLGNVRSPSSPRKRISVRVVNSFSMLFNFGENDMSLEINGRVVRTETRLCPREDEVFNIYSHKCVTLLCDGMDMRPVNGTCLLKEKQVMDGTGQLYPNGVHTFTFTLSVHGRKFPMRRFWRNTMKYYLEWFLRDRNDVTHNVNMNLTYMMKREHTGVKMNSISESKLNTYTYIVKVESKVPISTVIHSTGYLFIPVSSELSYHNVKAFALSLNNLKVHNASVTQDISEYYEYISNSTEFCTDEHAPKLFQDVELITVGDSYYARLNRTYFRLDNIGFEMHYEDSGANQTDIIVCVPDLGDVSLQCPKGKLFLQQSEFILVNDSLLYIPSGVMLPPGNFSLTKHGAIICSHFSRSHTDQVVFFDYTNVQNVLTMVASSVSMTSLVGVLLVYSFLPQLRNVPGKIVMSLSATLLVAQGLQLMTKVPTGKTCVAVATLVHMMWLSTFLWMSLLSIDLARSLRNMSPLSAIESHNKLFCLYAFLGWGIAFLLVVTCVVIDRFHVWGITIGYGSDHVCWITNPKASLYVFGLPMVLTLLINLACFILTLISIERTASNVAPHSKSCKNEKKRLGIYVRLSFIMGLAWLFSFIAAFTHVSLLWYFQIVLNGLQGFSIFVCFVCKSRNYNLFMERVYCLHTKTQTKDITVTTSTSQTTL